VNNGENPSTTASSTVASVKVSNIEKRRKCMAISKSRKRSNPDAIAALIVVAALRDCEVVAAV